MSSSSPLLYVRKTQSYIREEVEAEWFLRTIWTPVIFKFFGFLFAFKGISRFYGWLQRRPPSRKKIQPFIQKHRLNPQEFEKEIKDFKHFNDFFIRKLKRESRPITKENHQLLSPGDGKLLVFPSLEKDTFFPLKGAPIRLSQLVPSFHQISLWEEGSACLLRLAPPDYHRFHLPTGATLSPTWQEKGKLISVHPHALNAKHEIYHLNERHFTQLDSPLFGPILMIEVGACFVGTIQQTFQPNQFLKAGTEKGYFEIGGSSLLLLFQKERLLFHEDIQTQSEKQIETCVQMGEPIGVPNAQITL